MTSGNTRASAAGGRGIGRIGRCRVGKPVALLACGLACYAAIASSGPASAQVPDIPSQVSVANAVTGTTTANPSTGMTTTLSGTLNGNNGPGYFVANGGTLIVNNGLVENYTTSGGSGSGGGLGAGGAIFIDTGGTVILNSTSFSHNAAIGGTGGTNSPYGGTLNSISAVTAPDASPNGANGVNGALYPDNEYNFGDGKGNGVPGFGVTNGGNATNGFGGIGGVGGPGGNGWSSNPVAEANNDIAIAAIAAAAGVEAGQTAIIVTFVAGAIAEYGSSANPFEDPLAPITGISSSLLAVVNGINLAADTISLANTIATQQVTQGVLNNWNALVAAGLAGNGGNGENGGNGGNGSYGFGGGAGGQGGAYGLTGLSAPEVDGTGGNGGVGGAGGFGAGGGAGGYGFGAGQNGCGAAGCTSTSGVGGLGGVAGFGGGVGSTGGVTGVSNAYGGGGGGGDGYGGAIFVNTGGSLTITGNATFAGNSAIGGASLNGGLAGGAAGTDLFMMQGSTVNIAPGASAGNVPNFIIFNGTIADNSTASIGAPSVPQTAGYPVSGGAYLTIYSGVTEFNGANTYSGQTVINGGALGGPLNTGTNTTGAPNYALTDGALQAADGVGLPTASNLNFSGPGQFTGGVLQIPGTVLSNGVVQPTTFDRYVNPNPNPDGGGNPGGVQWTGSGGFAAINAPLTVTLNAGAPLSWSNPATPNGFVPFGYSLIFGSATSNNSVTFTNAIDISGGSYALGTAASILVANNGNALGSTAIMSGVISGSGDLSIGGGGFNGTLVLTAANTYTGGTYINSGTLAFSGTGSILDSSGITLANTGSLDISQSTGVTVQTLTGSGKVFLGSQELTVNQTSTFAGTIADGGIGGGAGGSLIVNGSGTVLTLTGTNTYTGDTTIDLGATLALVGTGSIANSSPVLDNGIFDISQTALGAMITSLSGSGQALIGSKLLVITDGSTTFSGAIKDGGLGGSLIVAGGTQTLSGVNTYTGATVIAAGATLALSSNGMGGNGSIENSAVVIDNGTFDISQTTSGASIVTLTGNGNVALGSQELTITTGSTTFTGVIADGGLECVASGGAAGCKGGSLIVNGGTETLSGMNTYTGSTTIAPVSPATSATLALTGTGSIATSSVVQIATGGTFDISQTSLGAAITTLSGSGNVNLGSQLLLITAGGAGPSGANPLGVFSGIIADGGIECAASGGTTGCTGGMLAISSGIQTLSGPNTYTGGTLTESGATLALSGAGWIKYSAAVIDNGTFDISQTTSGASIVTLTGTGNVALGSQELTITNGSTTFAGVIADGGLECVASGGAAGCKGGSLIVNGGTETLSGTNTYTGSTTIAPVSPATSATLALTGTGSIASSSMVQLATGGMFDISQTTAGASIMTLADTAPGQAGNVYLGGQTLTITAGSTTFSGVIADGGIVAGASGSLTVSGGTQTLAGVNTYTGVTTIAPTSGTATLALIGNGSIASSSEVLIAANGIFDISGTNASASIMTLSGAGSVVLGNQVLKLTAAAAGSAGTNPAGIFSGVISGNGGIAITGGHEELTGVNTYLGGTTVTNGAILSINNSASLGASTSPLTINNGTLVVDASITIPQPVTLKGAPPGTDTIALNSNSVTLSGTLSGPGVLTAINGGTLSLTGTVNSIGGIVLGPGTTLNANSTANAGLATTPIVLIPTSGAPPVDLFTGSVHVVGPLDVVNATTGAELIILPGDSLVGVGSVNVPTVIQSGGATSPGDGPGTIVVNAPVTDLPGSTYTVAIDGPASSVGCANPSGCAGTYSSTIVTGSSNTYTAAGTLAPILRGISAPANNNYTPPAGTGFLVVQAAGGVLGSFSALTQPAAGLEPGTRFDALYFNSASSTSATAVNYAENSAGNPNAIALWVTPASYQNLSAFNVGLTENQSQVAFALDALRGINDRDPALSDPAGLKNNAQATWDFGNLFPQQPQALPAIFNTLTGEVSADAEQGSFQLMNQFLQLMVDPAARGHAGGFGGATGFAPEEREELPPEVAAAYDAVLPVKAASFEQRWSAWGSTYGGANNTTGDPLVAGTHDVSTAVYGVAGGMDYRATPESLFGFALGGGGTNWAVTQDLGTGRSYDFQVGLYGKTRVGPAYVAGALAFAEQFMQTDREAFGADHLGARFNAETYGARLEAGYRYALPYAGVTPYAAAQALAFHSPNYSETDFSGGGFGLSYAGTTQTDLSGEIGAFFDSFLLVDDMPLILRARAAWQHDWVSNPALTAAFEAAALPGSLPGAAASFVVNGAALPQNLALASAGAELHLTPSIAVGAWLDSQLAGRYQTFAGTGTVRFSW